MRQTLLLVSLLAVVSVAKSQQITNVTVTPNPVHECEQLTFHIIGTAPSGMAFTFVNNSITSNAITIGIEAEGPGSGSSSFNNPLGPYGPFNAGTYALTFTLQYNGTITSTWNGSLTVQPGVTHDIGEPNTITVCPNAAPFTLLSQLGGTPEAGGSWLNPQLQPVPNGMFTPGVSPEGNYLYYFPVMAPCQSEYQNLTILYGENTSAGIGDTVTLCTAAGAPPVELFPLLGGTPLSGGTWTGPGGSSSGTFTPGTSLPGAYVYQVPGIAPCPDPTAAILVLAGAPSNAGTGDSAVFCFDETGAVLNDYLTGEDDAGFWFAPDGSGITFYDQPVDVSYFGAGAYTYVTITLPCPADTASLIVTLDGPPCTLGVPEPGNTADVFHVSPNPASGSVVVEIERALPSGGQFMELCDVGGKAVFRETLDGTSRTVRRILDVSNLAPGAYLLKLTGPQGTTTQRLMVK